APQRSDQQVRLARTRRRSGVRAPQRPPYPLLVPGHQPVGERAARRYAAPMPDAAVIGGGVVGAACAYELARRGLTVTLVERDELAAGASGRNQGWFVLSDDPPLRPMSAGSLAMYREVIEGSEVPVRFDPDPVGNLMVSTTVAGAEVLRSRVADREAAGTHAERIDDAALRDVEPALAPDLV